MKRYADIPIDQTELETMLRVNKIAIGYFEHKYSVFHSET